MEILVPLLIPIAVVVVMPVMIIWIIFRTLTNRDNKNSEIIIKAIENNQVTETDKIIEALGKSHKTPKEILQLRLLRGCIFTFIGIAAVILSIIFNQQYVMVDNEPIILVEAIAAITFPIGLAYLVVYFVTRKSVTEDDKE